MELRGQDVNGERLFSEEGLRSAMEIVEAKFFAKVQDRFLAGASRVERPRFESQPATSQSQDRTSDIISAIDHHYYGPTNSAEKGRAFWSGQRGA
jgi:hypothetical protein